MDENSKKRFWDKVNVRKSDECWLWTASTASIGYGQFWYDGKMHPAHRISLALAIGEIAPNMLVCHHCDIPLCVNPSHLFLGTQKDNMRDMGRKGRAHFSKMIGEKNLNHKLTPEKVLAIRKSTEPTRKIGKRYGVSSMTISVIRTRKTWGHLPD